VAAALERTLMRVLPLLRCCALGAAVFLPLVAAAGHGEPDGGSAPIQRENRAAAGWPLGSFTLIDHHGREFTERALQGKWTFVLFGDTRCAEPCGDALAALAGLRKRIAGTAAAKATQVLFVSLDLDGDTRQRLREFLARFDPAFIGATGARATLMQLVDESGVTVQPRPAGSLVLIGPDGVVRVEYLPPFDVKRLTAQFLRTRARG
jgi:protein SCO1/2